MDARQLKTLWKARTGDVWSFYCPHCRAPRRLPFRPKPGSARHFAQVGAFTAFAALLAWPWLGIKGVVSFVPLWIAFEVFYRTRVRAAVACRQCGFDPFLYMVDIQRARAGVEDHWKRKFAEKGIPYPGSLQQDAEAPPPAPSP